MRILLTNDDGIHAPGLKVLREIAAQLSDDVWVVAPAEEQSAASRGVSLHNPVTARRLEDKVFAVS
ncbi:MAG TPA: 5'/3'-nucleotidase SurE, partial [Hellea balneolensis]|nr:5'/3'-nucleotidase SurE [Hellea balneolensis]